MLHASWKHIAQEVTGRSFAANGIVKRGERKTTDRIFASDATQLSSSSAKFPSPIAPTESRPMVIDFEPDVSTALLISSATWGSL